MISQPRLFPGLHYLHRMMLADVFVIFDTVQFNPRHEENRARIKSPQGVYWLTAPIANSRKRQPIYSAEIDNSRPWSVKAIKTLGSFYRKAPFYGTAAEEINNIFEKPYKKLVHLDRDSWEPALRRLEINCQFIYASDLAIEGKGPQLLLDICRCVGADIYLSGAAGKDYLDITLFASSGIDVRFHKYDYPVYPQRFGNFIPFLSYIDILLNCDLNCDLVLAGGKVPAK